MTRRLLSVALLGYLALATWMLASRFTAWGDDLSGTVAQVVRSWTVTPPATASSDGIDFIECFGCDALPGVQGYGLAFLLLIVSGGPLALVAARLARGNRHLSRAGASWWQAAFVVQMASLAAGALVLYGMWHVAPSLADVLHWITLCALVDVAAGVPALVWWRRLQARAGTQPLRAVFQHSNSGW